MSLYQRNRGNVQLVLLFVLIKFVLHLSANGNFGFHRDELLYMTMAGHLDWGYKEVPPFIAAMTWLSYNFIGDSVFAMRLIPALASAGIVLLTGLSAIALTGRRFAVIVSCSAIIISPAFLASGYLMQPVVFDQLFWTAAAFLVIKHIQTRRTVYVYFLGIVVGLGLLTKYTMAFFIAALIAGLLLGSQRRILWQRSWLFAGLIAFLIFLPNLLWQLDNGLPVVTHMRELKASQLDHVSPFSFIAQLMIIHASSTIIWVTGLIYLFTTKSNRRYRFIGLSFLITVAILLLLSGKVYYSFGAFPLLFAAGGVCLQKVLGSMAAWMRYGLLAVVLTPSLVLLPIVIPILPLKSTLKFFEVSTAAGLDFAVRWEDQQLHATTQDYADMLGWEEIAQLTHKAYHSIPAAEHSQTTILAANYGQAGAVSHFRAKYKLPAPVSLSSSFALWAPESIATKHIIIIDDEPEDITQAFRNRKLIGEVNHPYAREKGTMVYLLSDPLIDINQVYQSKRKEKL